MNFKAKLSASALAAVAGYAWIWYVNKWPLIKPRVQTRRVERHRERAFARADFMVTALQKASRSGNGKAFDYTYDVVTQGWGHAPEASTRRMKFELSEVMARCLLLLEIIGATEEDVDQVLVSINSLPMHFSDKTLVANYIWQRSQSETVVSRLQALSPSFWTDQHSTVIRSPSDHMPSLA